MTYTPNEKALEVAARAMANRYVVDDTGTIKKVPWQNLTAWANDAITAYMASLEARGVARPGRLHEFSAKYDGGWAIIDGNEPHHYFDKPCIIIKLEPQP